jgi:hypothetical protein
MRLVSTVPEEADKGEECPGGLRAYEGGPEDGALAAVGDLALLPAPRLKLPAHLDNRQRFAGSSVSDPDAVQSGQWIHIRIQEEKNYPQK